MREITLLEDRVETLVHQLDQERQEKAELQSELTATREQLGELRGKLSTIEAERLPVGVMLRVAAVFIIGMLILLALAVVFLANRGG